jgi:hypothetical protein
MNDRRVCDGYTVGHIAVANDDSCLLGVALKFGGKIGVRNRDGESVAGMISRRGDREMLLHVCNRWTTSSTVELLYFESRVIAKECAALREEEESFMDETDTSPESVPMDARQAWFLLSLGKNGV